MKNYPTITVCIVIAVHLALCWCGYRLVDFSGDFTGLLANGIAIGVVPLPAILLGAKTSLPFLLRFLLLVLSLGITLGEKDGGYFILVVFALLSMVYSSLFAFLLRYRLEREDFEIHPTPRTQAFSLKHLMAMMALISIVFAFARPKLDYVHDLTEMGWETSLLWLFLSIETFLICSSVFFQERLLCLTLLVAALFFVISIYFTHVVLIESVWDIAIIIMATAVNTALPAIALRLCGWRWMRMQCKAISSESPAGISANLNGTES